MRSSINQSIQIFDPNYYSSRPQYRNNKKLPLNLIRIIDYLEYFRRNGILTPEEYVFLKIDEHRTETYNIVINKKIYHLSLVYDKDDKSKCSILVKGEGININISHDQTESLIIDHNIRKFFSEVLIQFGTRKKYFDEYDRFYQIKTSKHQGGHEKASRNQDNGGIFVSSSDIDISALLKGILELEKDISNSEMIGSASTLTMTKARFSSVEEIDEQTKRKIHPETQKILEIEVSHLGDSPVFLVLEYENGHKISVQLNAEHDSQNPETVEKITTSPNYSKDFKILDSSYEKKYLSSLNSPDRIISKLNVYSLIGNRRNKGILKDPTISHFRIYLDSDDNILNIRDLFPMDIYDEEIFSQKLKISQLISTSDCVAQKRFRSKIPESKQIKSIVPIVLKQGDIFVTKWFERDKFCSDIFDPEMFLNLMKNDDSFISAINLKRLEQNRTYLMLTCDGNGLYGDVVSGSITELVSSCGVESLIPEYLYYDSVLRDDKREQVVELRQKLYHQIREYLPYFYPEKYSSSSIVSNETLTEEERYDILDELYSQKPQDSVHSPEETQLRSEEQQLQ